MAKLDIIIYALIALNFVLGATVILLAIRLRHVEKDLRALVYELVMHEWRTGDYNDDPNS